MKHEPAKPPDIFRDPIIPTTIKLALPMLIGQILSLAYNIVDTIFISMIDRQSTALISGAGLIFPLFFIFLTIAIGLSTGISSLIARGIGEKNQDVIDKTADSGLLLCILLGVLTLFSGWLFGKEIIQMFAGSRLTPETIRYANEYFFFLLPGLALLLFVYMIAGILQGEGLMRYIALGLAISTVINVILDPIMIFTLKMGVKGAALASSISIGLVLVYFVFVFISGKSIVSIKWNPLKARKNLIKEILRIGVPASLGMLSLSIGIIILNNIVGSISQVAMNAWILAHRTDQLLLLPAYAISGTTMAMIGQNFGRRNLLRVGNIYRAHVLIGVFSCLFLALLYVIFAPLIFKMFSSVPEVIAGAVKQVTYISFTMFGVSGSIIISSAFQATGRALPSLIIIFIRFGIITIPLALILIHFYGMGMTGIFLGLMTGNIFSLILAIFWGKHHIKGLQFKGKSVPV